MGYWVEMAPLDAVMVKLALSMEGTEEEVSGRLIG